MSENVKLEIEISPNLFKAIQRTSAFCEESEEEFIVGAAEEIIKSYIDEGFSFAGEQIVKEIGELIKYKAP